MKPELLKQSLLSLFLLGSLGLLGCSQADFSTDKKQLLSQSSVFGDGYMKDPSNEGKSSLRQGAGGRGDLSVLGGAGASGTVGVVGGAGASGTVGVVSGAGANGTIDRDGAMDGDWVGGAGGANATFGVGSNNGASGTLEQAVPPTTSPSNGTLASAAQPSASSQVSSASNQVNACAKSADPAVKAIVNAITARASSGDKARPTDGNAYYCKATLSNFVVRTVSGSGAENSFVNTTKAWLGADCSDPTGYVATNGALLGQYGYFAVSGDMYFCGSGSSASACSPSSSDFIVGLRLGGAPDEHRISQVILSGGAAVNVNPSCLQREGSPLLVQLPDARYGQQPIVLSNPLQGIRFDILGLNSDPVAHAKKLISWLTEGSRETNYFLVLPNDRGEVNGIDEMFGDNTLGPDGKFAANGYEALRKYETMVDGMIDRQDRVFSRLRLWHDLNGDGEAQGFELSTLEEKRVKAIDLDYDVNYQEVDAYGNKIKMKSVVVMEDDTLNLIFDIWFRIGN